MWRRTLHNEHCSFFISVHLFHAVEKRVRPIVLLIKKWAGYYGINNASRGTLSSYTLVLMVLHYLQSECCLCHASNLSIGGAVVLPCIPTIKCTGVYCIWQGWIVLAYLRVQELSLLLTLFPCNNILPYGFYNCIFQNKLYCQINFTTWVTFCEILFQILFWSITLYLPSSPWTCYPLSSERLPRK